MTPVMVAGSTPPSILNDGSMLMGGVLSLVDTAASISVSKNYVLIIPCQNSLCHNYHMGDFLNVASAFDR